MSLHDQLACYRRRRRGSVRVCFDGVEECDIVLTDDEADSKAVGSEVLQTYMSGV